MKAVRRSVRSTSGEASTPRRPGGRLQSQTSMSCVSGLKPGRYKLIFGWYKDSERLSWADGQDSRDLAEIIVEPR